MPNQGNFSPFRNFGICGNSFCHMFCTFWPFSVTQGRGGRGSKTSNRSSRKLNFFAISLSPYSLFIKTIKVKKDFYHNCILFTLFEYWAAWDSPHPRTTSKLTDNGKAPSMIQSVFAYITAIIHICGNWVLPREDLSLFFL